ncbi:circadian clock KaiB family protein [Lichenifustis flavocetrariae]|uniref:Circadian clock KaiB family protein n=1 Tax=Lichenifustis flavocetrariae TaxID=2949735 RepID=A0AA41Z308_9HYPH|nr:circadian clock KaiB family protein [Lichenifustis flavocetrariae]MCW6511923.1 circadian clock KaiB family protein [Lichenifustis flavocetrariae]
MSSAPTDETSQNRYLLRLFIAGSSPRSRRTIENLHRICGAYLAGRFDLEIVDIYQQPQLAEQNQVVAAPTLLKLQPLPARRIIGDLSEEARVLRGLDLQPVTPQGRDGR